MILGQAVPTTACAAAQPVGTNEVLLVQAPADSGLTVSVLTVCNASGGAMTWRLRIVKNTEETATLRQYHYFDNNKIAAGDTGTFVEPLTLGPREAIYVAASAVTVAFNAIGT